MAKKKNVEEISATVAELPTKPPEYAILLLQKRGMLLKERLIYSVAYLVDPILEKKRKMVRVHCTACGEDSYLEYFSLKQGCSRFGASCSYGFIDPSDKVLKIHGDKCICPVCGKGTEALKCSYISDSYEMDRAFCVSMHNVRGHLCLLSWTIGKYVNKKNEIFYKQDCWEGDLVVDGSFVRVCGYQKFMTSVYFLGGWKQRTQGFDMIGSVSRGEILDFTKRDVESTDSTYCALKEYIDSCVGAGRYPGAYLQLWCRYPQVENLVRQKYTKYLNAVFDATTEYQGSYHSQKRFYLSHTNCYFNWKAKKPLEMLGLTKEESEIPKKFKLETVRFYKVLKKEKGICLSLSDLDFIESNFGTWSFERFFTVDFKFYDYDIPIVRVIHYLQKQMKTLPKTEVERISPGYLQDYWRMIHKIYGMMQRSELYPKNLVHAHDHLCKQIEEKTNEELRVKFEARFEELSSMSYQSSELGLMIRPCASHKELIDEGKKLSHCVGGYADSYANGQTCIFFIRDINKPDQPYYTLEWCHDRVIQNRGYKNCARTEEVIAFENEWLQFISTLKKERKVG